ncbi:GWxTD domain-containing protein [candidate division WOR-3 bacterium]|uniref:GWxTD domain-containing protein n=1 Tax=candidate division WOR-3 bacterium TaxID=2052148 RepID=A0A937XF17_UNCW3|nr:GWxTD domain-containing protein [candidate division WOR-3 bacterium]
MSTSLILCLAFTGALDFSVDWSAFRERVDSSRVEFFYAIPYDQLLYTQTADSGLVAEFSVRLEFAGLDNSFRQEGTVLKRARIRSFQEAFAAQRNFVDGFSVTAPPGRYRFTVAVAETSSSGQTDGIREDTILLEGFSGGLALGSLQVGSTALTDTATGAVSVIPNPTRRFSDKGLEALYVYYEGYDLSPESATYRVRAAIFRSREGKEDTLVETPLLSKPKQGTAVAYALGVSVAGVDPGAYTLGLELTDVATRRSVTASREFVIGSLAPETGVSGPGLDSLGPYERKYYDQIQYLATPKQVAYYKALSDTGKMSYLAKFWGVRNLKEFSRRMETAAGRFQQPKVAGYNTDRGRVYVKYGEPDAVEQKVVEAETRPREYWHYYNTGSVFVFIDIRGDANYRLAWTNAKDEPKTGLESYLTPEEQSQFK